MIKKPLHQLFVLWDRTCANVQASVGTACYIVLLEGSLAGGYETPGFTSTHHLPVAPLPANCAGDLALCSAHVQHTFFKLTCAACSRPVVLVSMENNLQKKCHTQM